MQKIKTECQLSIKWSNGSWSYYRVSKNRDWEEIVRRFTQYPDFRMGMLYSYDRETKLRGSQIGYLSKKENWLLPHEEGKTRKRKSARQRRTAKRKLLELQRKII